MPTFLRFLKQGLREGPLVFVAPVVALYRTFSQTAYDILKRRHR